MISKTSTQLINALVELAKLPPEKYEGAKTIAKRIKAPQNYLGKMLQYLCLHKIVVSQKGLGGGFKLGKDAKDITLYEIVEPIENISFWSECALGQKKCSDTCPCPVHDEWKAIKNKYFKFLKTKTIQDLLKK